MSHLKVYLLVVVSFLMVSCMSAHQGQTRAPLSATPRTPEVVKTDADTLSYVVRFHSDGDRDRFISAFQNFLQNYTYTSAHIDSGEGYVSIKMLPVETISEDEEDRELGFRPVEESIFEEFIYSEEIVEMLDSAEFEPLPQPRKGGFVTFYSQRGFFDNTFSELTNPHPFESTDEKEALFTVTDSSFRRVELQLSGRLLNGAGQSITAMDIIQLWTEFVRNHPAEGLALFRNVQGVEAFIRGEEPVVRGFYAVDGLTLQLRMESPDPEAVERIRSANLLWSSFMLGPYYIREQQGRDAFLQPNPNSRFITPYLDSSVVRLGGDQNPVLSYSLGRFDAMILSSTDDIEYVQRNLNDNSELKKLSSDRYFVACRLPDLAARRFVAGVIQPQSLLSDFLKYEGETIQSVVIDTMDFDVASAPVSSMMPSIDKPLRILYTNEDPASIKIAEKLLADLTNSGIRSVLNGVGRRKYELALVNKDYDLAIGWAPESVTEDKAQQLRLSTIWFDGYDNPIERVKEFREIPLFKVHNYFLAKEDISLHEGRPAGIHMYREEEAQDEWDDEMPDTREHEDEDESTSDAQEYDDYDFLWE
ncbi:hypothetical protein QA601_05955 [Chitinispirillales bacterium ANBcel5]|uniref:hypothetical protein n=1 Tax=Cellulosispirillum alkaliphilum TaxID=3039283 RepID=UPI002A5449E9|nr:hypothetical protein [Chitinispirillales bacterium ANBcel5]